MNKRKWLALLLCVAVALTMFPIAALAEGEDPSPCPHHAEHTADCGYEEGVSPCAYVCRICPVQALIDALPGADGITADNADAVGAQLDAVDAAKASLSGDELDALDFTKYDAAIAKLDELSGTPGASTPAPLDLTTDGGLTITGDGNCYAYESGTLKITGNGDFTISGTTTTDNIVVASGVTATITLSDVSINVSSAGKSAMELEGNASVSLKLNGVNVLYSANDHAGIRVENRTDDLNDTANTASLTINGPGSLEVHAGEQCAGIGGNNGWAERVGGHGGIITIESGDIKAYGGAYGAGIGGGSGGSGGNRIVISGGTVYAQGAHDSTGIGGGSNYDNKFTGGTIRITGGVVQAKGGAYAVDLGGSSGSTDKGNVIIDGGIVNAASISNANATNSSWNGIVNNTVYGNMNLSFDYTIPNGTTVTVPADTTLTVADGVTLTNNGTIINSGTINNNGTIINNGTINGTVTGNQPKNGVKYLDEKGEEKTAGCDAEITAEYLSANSNTLSTGWYVVQGDVTASNRITVNGDVHLILTDGCTLTANKGITVQNRNKLTIYGQANGTGTLTAKSDSQYASIGSIYNQPGGTITINGGIVNATGNIYAAGIGGGSGSAGGTITINGGTVTATGGGYNSSGGAGIGGGNGAGGCNITINGGTVNATGNGYGAGIGGGNNGTGCKITINGGTVTATSNGNGAGIGGGTFSTGTNGKAVIFAKSISDQSGKTSNSWSGVIFEGNSGKVYGASIAPSEDFTMDGGKTLLIPEGAKLDVSGITAANNGKVYVDGTLSGSFGGTGGIYYGLIVTGGTASPASEYNGKTYGKAGETITLTGSVPVGQKVDSWEVNAADVTITDNAFTMPAQALTIEAKLLNAPTYTVTIPASVTLGGTATVSATGVNVVSGSNLVVRLTDAESFTVTSAEGAELGYTVMTDYGVLINEGSPVMVVSGGTANAFGSAKLQISSPTTPVKYSGDYTGSMTFTVSVEKAPQP